MQACLMLHGLSGGLLHLHAAPQFCHQTDTCLLCGAAPESVAHLKHMAERLGLPLRQFVALMGAHPVARWWRDVQPPYMEQFYARPPHAFDNSYFR